ncbi:TetR/AcrR family transcriptional regulator [Luteimonas sp. RD2P54]|uniref:TetR/AcrR family transcriptional regulator n=1 Tax=Luteimonas endophytica TaxID=3042023 RepID=A0ABT6JCW6_9GAMM|nr:TetR/AcrR family transcriptional regulator [Luteimonas endophytica]MDH5824657.1 TetR/AcrR family transcriptional regulator [Luteimonas endophytica]
MARPAPPTRLTDRKRAAIVDAAVAEFRAAGFETTSMDRIAATAGVSKRTVYNHFPSKEALFVHIVDALMARGSDERATPYRAGTPLRGQLLELVQRKLRLLHEPDFADLARVAIVASLHSPELARQLMELLGRREHAMTTWVRAAAADGRLRTEDPAFAAQQLESLVKGAAFWPQIAMGQAPLTDAQQDAVAESAVEMFLARYG